MEKVKEFVLDSEGQCFFCPSSPNSFSEQEEESACPSFTSIHCFTHYLGMNMRKVFTEKGTIQSSKLSKVERPQLTVELCDDCATTIEEFSKLYEQFEKIELEMRFCLKHIQEKLACAADYSTNRKYKGKQEIVEWLRTESLEKCYSKLCLSTPTLKLQKLTPTQLTDKREKLKNRKRVHQNTVSSPDEASSNSNQNWGSDVEILLEINHNNLDQTTNETEGNNNDTPFEGGNPEAEADHQNLDKTPIEGEGNANHQQNDNVDPDMSCEETSQQHNSMAAEDQSSSVRRTELNTGKSLAINIKMAPSNISSATTNETEANDNDQPLRGGNPEAEADHQNLDKTPTERDGNANDQQIDDVDPEINCEETSQQHDSMSAEHRLSNVSRTELNTEKPSAIMMTPLITSSSNMKFQSTFDPKTGKHKCGICTKEFGSRTGAWLHHNNIHLKQIYKCRLCNKDFSFKPGYDRHLESVHLGVKYKCKICNKMFGYKHRLLQHQLRSHKKFASSLKTCACKLCMYAQIVKVQNPTMTQLTLNTEKLKNRKGDQENPVFSTDQDSSNSKQNCGSNVDVNGYNLDQIQTEAEGHTNDHPFRDDIVADPEITPIKITSFSINLQSTFDPTTGKHRCGICSKEFGSKPAVRIHHENIHQKVKYKCRLCEKVFTLKDSYHRHHRTVHMGVKLKCEICNKMLTQEHHLLHQLNCKEKMKKSPGKSSMSTTTAKVQNQNQKRPRLIPESGMPQNNASFRSSKKKKLGNAVFTTDQASFNSKPNCGSNVEVNVYNLDQIQSEGEGNVNDQPFRHDGDANLEIILGCEERSQQHDSMSADDQLNIVNRTELNTGKSSTDKITLSNISSSKMKYQCTFNPTTCKYKCGICSKDFLSTGAVWFHHNRIHLKLKYKCKLCNKDFSQKTAYNKHHRIVHMGVKFRCQVCKKLFTEKSYLLRHQLAHQEKLRKCSRNSCLSATTANIENQTRPQLNAESVTPDINVSLEEDEEAGIASFNPVADLSKSSAGQIQGRDNNLERRNLDLNQAPLNDEDDIGNDFEHDNATLAQINLDVDPDMTYSFTVKRPPSTISLYSEPSEGNIVSRTSTEKISEVAMLNAKEKLETRFRNSTRINRNSSRCTNDKRLRRKQQNRTAAALYLQKKKERLVATHEELSSKDKKRKGTKSTIQTDNVEEFRSKLRTVHRCFKCIKTFTTAVRLEEHRKSEGCGSIKDKQVTSNKNNSERENEN